MLHMSMKLSSHTRQLHLSRQSTRCGHAQVRGVNKHKVTGQEFAHQLDLPLLPVPRRPPVLCGAAPLIWASPCDLR